MTDDMPLPFDLPAVCRKKLTVDFNGGTQSSDGGLLVLRAAERKVGVCARLAAVMPDRRNPDRILHEMFEMLMARSSAIASGYEDATDLDRLRHDPAMKVAVGRCPETRWRRNRPSPGWRIRQARPTRRGLPWPWSISSARR
jgi:Transposase DDE domain group 1